MSSTEEAQIAHARGSLKALAGLRGNGVKYIYVDYSGGGDSGQTDSIYATREAVEESETAEHIEIPPELQEFLEHWVEESHAVPQTGWWNNEGGAGRVTIDLETMTVTTDHRDFYDGDGAQLVIEVPVPEELVGGVELPIDGDVYECGGEAEVWITRDGQPTEALTQHIAEQVDEKLPDDDSFESFHGTVAVARKDDGSIVAVVDIVESVQNEESTSYEFDIR